MAPLQTTSQYLQKIYYFYNRVLPLWQPFNILTGNFFDARMDRDGPG
jgi:hypothetical protein